MGKIRNSPSNKARVIGRWPNGTKVTVLYTHGEHVFVRSDVGDEGFVSATEVVQGSTSRPLQQSASLPQKHQPQVSADFLSRLLSDQQAWEAHCATAWKTSERSLHTSDVDLSGNWPPWDHTPADLYRSR